MKALGLGVNLFANHLFYWGDQHRTVTVGPERAERMNACRHALDAGVPLAIHSDAPVTPLAPLFTAWCAANRLSASGQVLGEAERIGVPRRCTPSRWARPGRWGWTARSAASNVASAPTSACWTTTRWPCRRWR
jgi:hypothetical protein